MQITQDIITLLTPVMVTLGGWWLTIKLKKMDMKYDKIDKIIEHFHIEQTNSDYVKMLLDIKNHFINKFSNDEIKNSCNLVSDKFIDTIESLLDNCDFNIGGLDTIKNDFAMCFTYAVHVFRTNIDTETATKIADFQIEKNKIFLSEIEDILTDTKNHHKDRFINLCCDFLKQYLKDTNEKI